MSRKLGIDTFEHYFALGPGRSYQAVADHFAVSKRAVTDLARRERWQERIAQREQMARASADRKAVETLEQMTERHVAMLKAMGARAIHALKEHPLSSGMEAIRAAELVIKLERVIRGEPSERTELTVEEVTKREMDRWLTAEPESDDGSEGTGGDNGQRTE